MSNKQLNAVITIGGAVTGGLKSALGSTQSKLRALGKTIGEIDREQRKMGKSMNDALRNNRPIGELHQKYVQLGAQIAKARREQEQMNRAVRTAETGKNLRASGAAGVRAGATVGAVAAIPLLGSAKAAMDYDYDLQMIGNTADMTREQIDQLDEQIQRTSKDVNQSAPNMKKAFGFLIAAGMDVGTASKMLGNVGKTATAAGADVEDMAKATFTLNDALKITTPKGMESAMDGLAKAGKMGNFELKAMAQNLPVLGSSFSAIKMEGQEAVATIGAALQIARKGAATEDEAANNLKNYMAKLQSPETLKKAAAFGLDLNKVIVNAQAKGQNPFEAATQALFKAIGNDQKKLGEVFGDMQVQNFLRPMFQNMEEYKKIKEAALNSGGTVDADFVKVMSTTKEQVDKIGGSIGRLAIAFGEVLTSMVGGAGDIAGTIDKVTEWVKANRELVGTIVKVGAGLVGLKIAAGAITWVVGAVTGLRAAWALATVEGGLLARLAPVLGSALGMVGRAVLFIGRALLMNPIGLAVTAIAAAAYLVYENWAPIKAFVLDAWAAVSEFFGKVGATIKAVTVEAFGVVMSVLANATPIPLLVKNWEPIKAFFGGLFDDVRATVAAAIDWVMGKIAAVGDTWRAAKSLFGFGDDAPRAGAPSYRPAPPAPPSLPRGARGGAQAYTDNRKTEINVTQLPGENGKAFANRAAGLLAANDRQQRGSALFDQPRGY